MLDVNNLTLLQHMVQTPKLTCFLFFLLQRTSRCVSKLDLISHIARLSRVDNNSTQSMWCCHDCFAGVNIHLKFDTEILLFPG